MHMRKVLASALGVLTIGLASVDVQYRWLSTHTQHAAYDGQEYVIVGFSPDERLSLGHLNGDGTLDLVVESAQGLRLYLGDGNRFVGLDECLRALPAADREAAQRRFYDRALLVR